jgi:hypothetical protein
MSKMSAELVDSVTTVGGITFQTVPRLYPLFGGDGGCIRRSKLLDICRAVPSLANYYSAALFPHILNRNIPHTNSSALKSYLKKSRFLNFSRRKAVEFVSTLQQRKPKANGARRFSRVIPTNTEENSN